MKKKSRLYRIVVVLCFALLLTNCAVEELSSSQTVVQTTNVEIAKNWFEQYKSAIEFNSNFKNVRYDWDNAKLEILENDSQAIVVPVYDFKENQDFTVKNFLYFYPTSGTTFETTLYELKSSSEPLDGQSLAESLSYFTGYINVWNLEKGFIESTRFENSIAKATFSGEEKQRTFSPNASGKMAMDPPAPSICLGELILCNDYKNEGGSFYEMGYVYTVNNYGFSGDYAGSYFNYSHGGGGGGAGGGSGASLPVIKITDKLTGKAKCLNTLLNDNGNSFVQKLLNKFAGISEFDIEIASLDHVFADDAKTREINGSTAFNKNSRLMTISISTSRLEGQAALDGARVILHEYIHADIYRKLNTSDKNDIDSRDFKTVFETYEKNQHNVIANLYLTSMKEALKEFHKTALKNDYDRYVNYYGKAPSDEFYEAMAWGGLKENDVKAWKDLSPEKKASIEALAGSSTILSKTVTCP